MTQHTTSVKGADNFTALLAESKKRVDDQLSLYAQNLIAETAEQFGEYPTEAVKAFVSVLERGGKRIRGSLAMTSYEMFGGTDQQLILQAACALEILNTYILVADDIQDRSQTRRGGKTVHVQLHDYHQAHHLGGDSQHFGESIAINAFLVAQHYAMNLLATLPTTAEIKIEAIENVNKCFITTAHGQTLDIFNEVLPCVSEEQVMNVLEWKTAYYTFINPLQLGAILAGAKKKDLDELAQYGLHAGRAFQQSDDILGTFGKESDSGKSPLDDIKEGKRTALVVYALGHAPHADALYLEQSLGNQSLNMTEFNHCKQIITSCGAVAYALEQTKQSVTAAQLVLQNNPHWPKKSRQFLSDLVQYIVNRKA